MSQASVRVVAAAGGSRFAIVDRTAFQAALDVVSGHAALQVADGGPPVGAAASPARLGSGHEADHAAVCGMLDLVAGFAAATPVASTFLFARKCAEFHAYLLKHAEAAGAGLQARWMEAGIAGENPAAIGIVVDEMATHLRAFADQRYAFESMAAYTDARLQATLPKGVIDLKQAANLALVLPHFERSLTVPGDACEFGCFRGILSVKLAWLMKAAGVTGHYYAFDTFHGFEIDDPGGGALGIGSFRDDEFNAYDFLTKWSKVLPLTPVKGDATKTVTVLDKPLSFVWLDLDMGVLMEPVAQHVWPLCSADTIIGIDDVGRPETPTVMPWFEGLIASGAAELVFDSDRIAPNTFIRFVRKTGPLPASRR